MRIQDASDRVYQGRVYALLDQARSSIVISMYLIRPGEDDKHPVNLLIKKLLAARRRGVEVTIYLNTKLREISPTKVAEGPWFDRLRRAGVALKLLSPARRLHDKSVIVDKRFVVEGSMNWSVAAIADNFESATIIESAALAKAKLKRISFFPIWDGKPKPPPAARPGAPPHTAEFFPQGPPTSIEIPVAFIEEKKYFPTMITYRSERAMKLLLLLIYLSEAQGVGKFWISLEEAARFLDILQDKERAAIRHEMVIIFRNIQEFGDLVRVEFYYDQDAEVELRLPGGPTFTVGSDDLTAGELSALEDNEIFLRLIQARLSGEGKRLEDLTVKEIERRFFFTQRTFQRTRLRGKRPRPAQRVPAP